MNADRGFVQQFAARIQVLTQVGRRGAIELRPPNDWTLVLDLVTCDQPWFEIFRAGTGVFVTNDIAAISVVCSSPINITNVGQQGTAATAVPTGALGGSSLLAMYNRSVVVPSLYDQFYLAVGNAVATTLNFDVRGRLFPQDYALDQILALM